MGRLSLLALFPCTLLFVGCFSARPIGMTPDSTGEQSRLGSFALSSAYLGHLMLSPSSCTAGDRQFFLGGDFEDEKTGMIIRLVVDPLYGPAIRVFANAEPYEKSVVFHRPECRVFHFTLDTTGWRINRIRDYRLTLDLDCTNPEGDSITGTVSATHCH